MRKGYARFLGYGYGNHLQWTTCTRQTTTSIWNLMVMFCSPKKITVLYRVSAMIVKITDDFIEKTQTLGKVCTVGHGGTCSLTILIIFLFCHWCPPRYIFLLLACPHTSFLIALPIFIVNFRLCCSVLILGIINTGSMWFIV